ncbi:MAG: HD domain-containing protein [Candidatus Pacebacteria bacterium]|nr:HD domain-containing protein [Candidatus Paceibacterota bacterium]
MLDIKEITNLVKSFSPEDIELISRAFNFAKERHADQKRFSGEPYFIHVFETAKTLAELGMSPITISAGLLHDVIEDAKAEESIIEKEFGPEILFLINGVTKLGKIKYRGAERHKESLRKFFVAVSQDIRVIIIKLADRLHNMKTLQYLPGSKQERIAKETLEIYVSVAYRMGIRKLSRQLEDLAFPIVYPKEYEKTKALVKIKTKKEFEKLKEFEKSIKKALAKNNITKFTTDYRIKTFYSIYKKLLKKDWNIEKIYDIAALRIILPEIKDCYNVLGIIHGVWQPLPGRIKDYIAFPKPNGYQALHTTIFTGYGSIIEIQIKTKQMHQEAEYGITSHLIYKKETKNKFSPNFSWIKRLLPMKKRTSLSEEKINFNDIPSWIKELVEYQATKQDSEQDLKDDFFKQRIFVFTPRGDVIDLPIDSTPIDFAYTIHSDIGDHISGAKINGKMVALNTSLKNGDIIEILTKETNKPSQKWLEYAKTANAKKHIKSFLQKK